MEVANSHFQSAHQSVLNPLRDAMMAVAGPTKANVPSFQLALTSLNHTDAPSQAYARRTKKNVLTMKWRKMNAH